MILVFCRYANASPDEVEEWEIKRFFDYFDAMELLIEQERKAAEG